MSQIRGRECLSRIEDYVVETVPDADIIVNANETNEPMGKKMEKKLVNAVLKEALNRYPSMHGEDLCAFLGKNMVLILTCSAWEMVPVNCWKKSVLPLAARAVRLPIPLRPFPCTKRISPYLTARPYRIVWMRSLR